MSVIRVGKALVTLSDECPPFMFKRRRWSVSEQWGPFVCDRHGDPIANQPGGRELQAAYEHYLYLSKGRKP